MGPCPSVLALPCLGASSRGRCTEGWDRDGNGYPAPTARPLSPSVPFCPPGLALGKPKHFPHLALHQEKWRSCCRPPWGDLSPPTRGEIPAGRGDPGDSPGCTGSRGAHRGLPVRVGEDPVDLHVAPVGCCHVNPEPPQARVPRAVGAGHVVAVVVLLQRGGGGTTGDPHFPAISLLPAEVRESCCPPLPPVGPGSRGSFPSSSLTAKPTF